MRAFVILDFKVSMYPSGVFRSMIQSLISDRWLAKAILGSLFNGKKRAASQSDPGFNFIVDEIMSYPINSTLP